MRVMHIRNFVSALTRTGTASLSDNTIGNRGTSTPDRNLAINEATFCNYIKRLKDLHNFLYEEAVPINPSDSAALEMGNLSALYYHVEGREPTSQEWNQVERQTQAIFLLLTPALRKKYLMGGTPWTVAWTPVYLLAVAAASLVFAVASVKSGWAISWILPVYLIWLATLGAVGALAFIGMNALSIQDDITFDLTNNRLLLLRVALGALFAVVLTLPFGYKEFITFCDGLASPFSKPDANPGTSVLTLQAVFLMLPFVLGFSTSLVILILNQLVEAVQTFFGRNPRAVPLTPPLPPRVTNVNDALLTPQDAGHTGSPLPPISRAFNNARTSSAPPTPSQAGSTAEESSAGNPPAAPSPGGVQ
jgi:hypothetical protein